MVSAEQARLNQIAATKAFKAGVSADTFRVQQLIASILLARTFKNPIQLRKVEGQTAEIKQLLRKGNVNPAQLQTNIGLVDELLREIKNETSSQKEMMQTFEKKNGQFFSQPTDTFQSVGAPGLPQEVSGLSSTTTGFTQNTMRVTSQNMRLENNKLTGSVQAPFIDSSQFGDQFSELHLHVEITPTGGTRNDLITPIFIDRFTPQGFTLKNFTRTTNTTIGQGVDVRIFMTVKGQGSLLASNVFKEFVRDRTVIPPPPIPPPPPPPPPVGTGRLQGIVILNDGFQVPFVLTESTLIILRNRIEQLEIREIKITNPSTELGANNVQEIIAAIEAHLRGTVPPPPGIPGKRDIGISIIVAALLGVGIMGLAGKFKRGDKKR